MQPVRQFPGLPQLAGNWRTKLTTLSTAPLSTPQLLVGEDSERWSITIWTQTPSIFLLPGIALPNNAQGMPIPQGTPFIFLCYRDYGPIVGGLWNVIAPGPAALVYALTASYAPREE